MSIDRSNAPELVDTRSREAVTTPPASGLPSDPDLPVDSINILLVDDEPKNLTVLETILEDPTYRLVKATSVDQALQALVIDEFALLILDIQMPEMTGLQLAQMIRGRKKIAQVPIIFLTAYYHEDQDVLNGYGTGAVDYLFKPVKPAILRSKVTVFAELYRKSRLLRAELVERRRAEEQLRQLNEALEHSKGRLLALTAELNLTEQRERKRVAIELRDSPVLRQRGFFAGRPVPDGSGRKDLAWLRADGSEMTEREWHSPDLRTLGMYLDGDGIRHRGPRGERLTDESYLLVLHAGAEDTTFALPGLPWASGWEVVVDTVYPDGLPPPAAARPAAGLDLPLAGRSAVLLRSVRTPLVGAPRMVTEPPGPGTV